MKQTARTYIDTGEQWATGQTPAPTIAGVFPLTLCITAPRLLAMLSVLYEGGAAQGYGYVGDHNRDLINALAWMQDNTAPCTPPRPQLPEGVTIDDEGNLRVCADMVNVYISDCGCGCNCCCGAGATGSAGTTGATETGTGTSAVTFPNADVPLNCYAQKAADYLLDRARDFHLLMLDIALVGFDNVSGPIDEFVDAALLAVGLLTGNVDANSVREFTTANIEDAFNDATLRANMQKAWADLGYTNSVSRQQLAEWASRAPILIGGAPVRSWMQQWVYGSVIPAYNQTLARLATECTTGDTIAGNGILSDAANIGADVYALLIGPTKTIGLGIPYELIVPSNYVIAGMFWLPDNPVYDCPVRPSPRATETIGTQTYEANGQEFSNPGFYLWRSVLTDDPTLADVQAAFPSVASPGINPAVEVGTPSIQQQGSYYAFEFNDSGQWCDSGWTLDFQVNLLLKFIPPAGGI